MILLTCKRCRGSGKIPNEQYDICMALRSEETKRYFRMQMKHEGEVADDLPSETCDMPSSVPCPVCDGAGHLAFEEEEWELRVLDEEVSGDEG